MAVSSVLLNLPPDDAGAETADRYDWQALVAAVDFLISVGEASTDILDPSCEVFIICEYQEDYILCIGTEIQLVSVKHRDLSQGNWTYAKLFKEGGIAHLFERWAALSEIAYARLVTNAELGTGAESELRQLSQDLKACPIGPLSARQIDVLHSASVRILKVLIKKNIDVTAWSDDSATPNATLLGAVRRFLSVLIFDCARPPRHILASAAISMYVTPFLDAVGHPAELAAALWEAIGTLFRRRMRGRGDPATEGVLAVANKIHERTSDDDEVSRRIRQRMITVRDLLDVLEVARVTGISPVERGVKLAPTRLAIKLLNAGCQETTAHAAEAAAARWREHENAILVSEVDAASALEKVKTRALVLASQVQEKLAAAAPGDDYGPQMWREIHSSVDPAFSDTPVVMDSDLAIGLVCDLASQCQVWFGGAFDIDAARAAFPSRLSQTQAAVR